MMRTVDAQVDPNAAWSSPHPGPLAGRIKNHVAFWNGAEVDEAVAEGHR